MSFYTTLTGLNAFKTQISTISDNIANMETTAYKSESLTFAEILTESSNSTETSGNGVTVEGISTSWTQGDLSSTGNDNDLAITGSGFFLVKDETTGLTYYTRDGGFSYDDDGNLVTDTGEVIQGYVINEDGSLGLLGDITLSQNTIAPAATTEVTTDLNLNSTTDTSGAFSITIETYDEQGTEIPVTIAFTKTDSNEWSWTASIDSAYGITSSSGTLEFGTDGNLVSTTTNPTITLDLATSGTGDQTITWDITDSDFTQYSSDSVLSDQSQDGNAMGTLENVSIDQNGTITGTYSNDQTKELFQIALATFSNSDGLNKLDNGLYAATTTSGSAVIGVAGSGEYGSLTSGALETSNVDLASEMSNLIIAQRAYEACAKLITAEDEIIQTTIKMT
ncbi:MAG: flagellar hook protein FlgE [Smithellaceae bacterium]